MPLGPLRTSIWWRACAHAADGRPAPSARSCDWPTSPATTFLFTSDLTVSEFLLTQDAKCSAPSRRSWAAPSSTSGSIADYKGQDRRGRNHLPGPPRNSRRLAISRCFQEAQVLGADAVIGVRVQERLITSGRHGKGGDDGDEVIEFTVFGTAVRAPWITHDPVFPRRHRPVGAGPVPWRRTASSPAVSFPLEIIREYQMIFLSTGSVVSVYFHYPGRSLLFFSIYSLHKSS